MDDRNEDRNASDHASHSRTKHAVYEHILEVGCRHARRFGLQGEEMKDCASAFRNRIYQRYCEALLPGSRIGDPDTFLNRSAHNFTRDYRDRLVLHTQKVCSLGRDFRNEEDPQEREIADTSPGPAQRVEDSMLRETVGQLIQGLSPALRATAKAFFLDAMEIEEIAAMLGCPRNTVVQRISRARRQLRDQLERMGWIEAVARTHPQWPFPPVRLEGNAQESPR